MTRYSKQVQMTNQSGSWVSFQAKWNCNNSFNRDAGQSSLQLPLHILPQRPQSPVPTAQTDQGVQKCYLTTSEWQETAWSRGVEELHWVQKCQEHRHGISRARKTAHIAVLPRIHSTSYPNTKQTQTLQKTDANQHLGPVGNCIQNQQNANDNGWFYCCIC